MIEERDSVEAVVNAQWTVAVGQSPDRFDVDFFDSGGSSLQAAVLLSRLASVFRFVPSFQIMLDHSTVTRLSDWIRDQPAARSTRFLPLNPGVGEDRPPLIFLPGVNGDLILLNRLAHKSLARRVWGVESKGFVEGDGGPLREVGAIVADLAEQIEAGLPRRRVHVGGFSSGAGLSLSLAGELRTRGWEVATVTMIGPARPPAVDRLSSYDELVAQRLRRLSAGPGSGRPAPDEAALSEATKQDLLRRAHVWAANAFAAERQSLTALADVPAIVMLERDEAAAEEYWRNFFRAGGVDVQVLGGDHFSLISEQASIDLLSERLRRSDEKR